MDVGKLIHQVTIQQLTEGVDNSGAPQESWSTLCVAWMGRTEAQAQRGSETWKGDQLSGSIVTKWLMRYLETMDPDLIDVPKKRRLAYRGKVYDIVHANTVDRQEGIILQTLAHTAVVA